MAGTKRIADYPAAMEKYKNEVLTKWEADEKKAKDEGKTEPQGPASRKGRLSQNRPANLYNAMIAPLVPYASKGAIWYQGESNAGRAYQYRKLLPAMIADWRKAWGVAKTARFRLFTSCNWRTSWPKSPNLRKCLGRTARSANHDGQYARQRSGACY